MKRFARSRAMQLDKLVESHSISEIESTTFLLFIWIESDWGAKGNQVWKFRSHLDSHCGFSWLRSAKLHVPRSSACLRVTMFMEEAGKGQENEGDI